MRVYDMRFMKTNYIETQHKSNRLRNEAFLNRSDGGFLRKFQESAGMRLTTRKLFASVISPAAMNEANYEPSNMQGQCRIRGKIEITQLIIFEKKDS